MGFHSTVLAFSFAYHIRIARRRALTCVYKAHGVKDYLALVINCFLDRRYLTHSPMQTASIATLGKVVPTPTEIRMVVLKPCLVVFELLVLPLAIPIINEHGIMKIRLPSANLLKYADVVDVFSFVNDVAGGGSNDGCRGGENGGNGNGSSLMVIVAMLFSNITPVSELVSFTKNVSSSSCTCLSLIMVMSKCCIAPSVEPAGNVNSVDNAM